MAGRQKPWQSASCVPESFYRRATKVTKILVRICYELRMKQKAATQKALAASLL
jgi:hypothetical protein